MTLSVSAVEYRKELNGYSDRIVSVLKSLSDCLITMMRLQTHIKPFHNLLDCHCIRAYSVFVLHMNFIGLSFLQIIN